MKVRYDVESSDDSDSDGDEALDDDGVRPFAFFVLLEAGLAPTSILIGWLVGYSPLNDFSWNTDAAIWGMGAALPMLVFLALTIRWPFGPLRRIKAFFDRELAPLLGGCNWSDFLLISVAAGVGEELLFRGLIQGALTRSFGQITGVAAAAILFGLLHPVSLAYVVVATLLGAYLGVVWIMTGNLLSVMVAHGLYDFIALLILMTARQANEDADAEA